MEQKIVSLYKTHSLNNISKITGFSNHKIKKILLNNSIKLRNTTENRLLASGVKNLDLFSKDNIYDMYITKRISVHEIAIILNIHHRNVYSWLKKYNIPTINSDNNEHIYYVYVLCDPFKNGVWEINGYQFFNEPFYIGYGKSDRCMQHMNKYNLKQYNNDKNLRIIDIIKKGIHPTIVKIKMNMNMNDALKLESIMIKSSVIYNFITNKSMGGEIGGRYTKFVAKYKPDFVCFNHRLIDIYDSVGEAITKNNISKINFKGISDGYVYEKYFNKQDIPNILFRKLSSHSVKVFGGIEHYKNPVCVYNIKGNFIKLSKPNVSIGNCLFRIPDNLVLYNHKNVYLCVRKNHIKWDYKDNILNHTKYKFGKLTL